MALLDNKQIEKLSLVDLSLGQNIETRQQIADIFLYNETLKKINLSGNNLIKAKLLISNLVLNMNSNIEILKLSNNDYDFYDFTEILKQLDLNSQFGNKQYFKLRYLTISNCPNLSPFEFKLRAKLDEFYEKRRKVFISCMSK